MEHAKQLFTQITDEEFREFIEAMPTYIRNMLPKSEAELLDCIELLPNSPDSPDSIAKGRVLKITIDNYLDCDDEFGKTNGDDRTGTSMGLLYALDDDSEVYVHEHNKQTNNMEIYYSIAKPLIMPKTVDPTQTNLGANICQIGSEHGIGPMPKGTLIGTFKVRADHIGKLVKSKNRNELEPLYKKGSAEKAAQYDAQNKRDTER